MSEALLAAATEAGNGDVNWLPTIITILTLLLGSGGLVAWRRLTHDKRLGIQQQELAEDDAFSARWKAIIETQTTTLLEPMQKRLGDVETEIRTVKTELEESRRKYWSAISHIRVLYTWISRHMPEGLEQTQIPEPPATLAEDI